MLLAYFSCDSCIHLFLAVTLLFESLAHNSVLSLMCSQGVVLLASGASTLFVWHFAGVTHLVAVYCSQLTVSKTILMRYWEFETPELLVPDLENWIHSFNTV